MTSMKETVERVLEELRPRIQMDGGDIELVDITPDKVVKVKLTGACQGCPMSEVTLKWAVEEAIRRVAPDIKGVENVS